MIALYFGWIDLLIHPLLHLTTIPMLMMIVLSSIALFCIFIGADFFRQRLFRRFKIDQDVNALLWRIGCYLGKVCDNFFDSGHLG